MQAQPTGAAADAAPVTGRISVSRDWGSPQKVKVPVNVARAPHITRRRGGDWKRLPHPVLAVYVFCDQLGSSFPGHSCQHGPGPHSIKVLVHRRGNDPMVYRMLRAQAVREGRGQPK